MAARLKQVDLEIEETKDEPPVNTSLQVIDTGGHTTASSNKDSQFDQLA